MKTSKFLAGFLLAACVTTAWAEGSEKATIGDFTPGAKVNKFGSLSADTACDRLYDSASPISMLTELAIIVGPTILFGKAPELTGMTESKKNKMFSDLRTLAKQKVWIPVSAEQKLGDLLHERYVEKGMFVDPEHLNKKDRKRYNRVKAILDDVLQALPEDNPYEFRLGVVADDIVNANASPGGYIYVNRGLLRDARLKDGELSIMLAHEVAHVTKRHVVKEWQVKAVDSMEIAQEMKGLLQMATNPANALKTMTGTLGMTRMMFQRYDHTQELEGDACGMKLVMQRPGIDIDTAVKYYEKRGNNKKQSKGWNESHPPSDERKKVVYAQRDKYRGQGKGSIKGESPSASEGGALATNGAQSKETGGEKEDGGWFGRLKSKLAEPTTGGSDTESHFEGFGE